MPNYGARPHVILVNITSTPPAGTPYDKACELAVGDHPFVVNPSFMYYRHAQVVAVDHLDDMIAKAVWPTREDVSSALLARIAAGICASAYAKRELKKLAGCV
jgi:hypothetical protein